MASLAWSEDRMTNTDKVYIYVWTRTHSFFTWLIPTGLIVNTFNYNVYKINDLQATGERRFRLRYKLKPAFVCLVQVAEMALISHLFSIFDW